MSDRVSVNQKPKRKMEDPPSSETDLEELLALRLGYNNTSKRLKISEGSGSSFLKHVQDNQFACRYCVMVFPTYRALAGHQSVHKHMRDLSKWGRELRLGSYANPGSNISFTASPQFGMNRFLGGGGAEIPQRLNNEVDLQELNQVPPFVESESHKSFQGSPVSHAPIEGLEKNTTVPPRKRK